MGLGGTSLGVQGLRCRVYTEGNAGSVPDRRIKILHTVLGGKNTKK